MTAAPDALIEETRAFNAQLEEILRAVPLVYDVGAPATRELRRSGRGIFPAPTFLEEAVDLRAPGRSGPVGLRVIRPAGAARGIYIHIHGGGWALGAADMQDPGLKAVADATGLIAVSIDYRLAPEHPYPAGPDDCEDAALHLLREGPRLLDAPARFAIGGESAGANLAAVTLLRLRDRHGLAGAIAAANLVFGAYDLALTPSQRLWGDHYLVLSTPVLRWYADQYLPGRDPEARRDPDISPLYAQLDGMPPALFTVGSRDPLLDDSLFMSARWRAAGNEAELVVWPEAVHGFNAYPTRMAEAANERQYEFMRRALG